MKKRKRKLRRMKRIAIITAITSIALFIFVKAKVDEFNSSNNNVVIGAGPPTVEETAPETTENFPTLEHDDDEIKEIEEMSMTEESTIDIHSLVTSVQYTLGYGVRCRLTPDADGTIYKTIPDIFTKVEVIDRGEEWYHCVVDDKEVYINWQYIGTESDVAMVKDKIAMENERKSSAYYEAFNNLSDEDYDLLARILALEAGSEDFKGKLAVIEVIFNRVISKNPYWPDTVGEVLYQKGQFTTIKYLSHPYMIPDDECYEAIEYVRQHGATAIREFLDENGMTDINSLDYVFFATYKANGKNFVKHGGHYFSRERSSKYYHAVYNK